MRLVLKKLLLEGLLLAAVRLRILSTLEWLIASKLGSTRIFGRESIT